MANTIKPSALAAEITRSLEQYYDGLGEVVEESVEKVTNATVTTLRKTSPKLTGDYRKGWRSKLVTSSKGRHVKLIYNKTDYQLTHLLEKGHKKVNGGMVKEIPHIEPARKNAADQLARMIKEGL